MGKQCEIWVRIPDGCKLVGTKTDGDTVIVIYENEQEPIRKIGFTQYPKEDNNEND